jgi:hypothetical protein
MLLQDLICQPHWSYSGEGGAGLGNGERERKGRENKGREGKERKGNGKEGRKEKGAPEGTSSVSQPRASCCALYLIHNVIIIIISTLLAANSREIYKTVRAARVRAA